MATKGKGALKGRHMRFVPIVLLALIGCGKPAPPTPPPMPARPIATAHLDVYAISVEKGKVLGAAIAFAEAKSHLRFRTAAPVPVVWENMMLGGKANANALMQLMVAQARKAKPGDGLLAAIGVCDRDIGDGGGEVISSVTAKEGHAAVVSWYRVSNEALGLAADDEKLAKRAGKEILMATAKVLGLPRCRVPGCLFTGPTKLPDLDAATGDLCGDCLRTLQAAAR